MELTLAQKLTISTGVVGAATSAFGALNSIMTPTEALIGTVLLGFTSACLSVVGTVLGSQSNMIKDVSNMPGVDPIKINANASKAAAQVALDPNVDKVAPAAGAEQAVQTIAKGN